MNGRLYDPMTSRFLSADNYVQLPDNSQSYNRYSYCLNNPLKYTDPSGEFFGIDDGVLGFALQGMAGSMMQAAFEGRNVWKAGAMSLLSSSASYGVGQIFGSVGSMGHELLRAGSHGFASGLVSALGGHGFAGSFFSGAAASGIGSFAHGMTMDPRLTITSTTFMGGAVAWLAGSSFIQGAILGMSIGVLNHGMHDGDEETYKKSAICEVLPDGTLVAPYELKEIVIYNNFVKLITRIQPVVEKPLEAVYPEFELLLLGRTIVNGAFQAINSIMKKETGGWKQWIRVGDSRSNVGGFDTDADEWFWFRK